MWLLTVVLEGHQLTLLGYKVDELMDRRTEHYQNNTLKMKYDEYERACEQVRSAVKRP